MKLSILLGIALAFPVWLASGQSQNETFVVGEIQQIPACGCASQRLFKITAKCMLANCTLEEAIGEYTPEKLWEDAKELELTLCAELDKVQAAICERPYQSRNRLIRVTSIACLFLTYTAVIMRLGTRYYLHQNYRLDDLFIVLAAITDAVFTGIGITFEHHGFGEHAWEIDVKLIPQLLYWSSSRYQFSRFTSKSSRRDPFVCNAAFCVASSVAFLLVAIFQCHPLQYVWDKSIEGGRCVDFNSTTWVNGALNILQDLLIVALPISEVRKLQLERRKKIGLYIMSFGLTSDPTWDNVPITFWSTLETTTAMLCACLPTIRAGLLRVFPQTFGSTALASTGSATGLKPTSIHPKQVGAAP
ncbi:hypothetical protein D0Z07_6289, partial [Hyphodiscus hymeniophilus]